MHKPHMKPEFVRAIAKTKEADRDVKWLYGGAVSAAVDSYEKVKKGARGAMKEAPPAAKKQGQQPQKKQKYQGGKPQKGGPSQNSFGNFHYQNQNQAQGYGGGNQGFQGFNMGFQPGMQQQQQQRPRFQGGGKPRPPNPPAAANNQGFAKKGGK